MRKEESAPRAAAEEAAAALANRALIGFFRRCAAFRPLRCATKCRPILRRRMGRRRRCRRPPEPPNSGMRAVHRWDGGGAAAASTAPTPTAAAAPKAITTTPLVHTHMSRHLFSFDYLSVAHLVFDSGRFHWRNSMDRTHADPRHGPGVTPPVPCLLCSLRSIDSVV